MAVFDVFFSFFIMCLCVQGMCACLCICTCKQVFLCVYARACGGQIPVSFSTNLYLIFKGQSLIEPRAHWPARLAGTGSARWRSTCLCLPLPVLGFKACCDIQCFSWMLGNQDRMHVCVLSTSPLTHWALFHLSDFAHEMSPTGCVKAQLPSCLCKLERF